MTYTQFFSVFKDTKINAKFNKYGYVIINTLPLSVIDELRNYYFQNTKISQSGFHVTHFNKDRNYKNNIHNTLVRLTSKYLTPIFENYYPVFGNYMIKEAIGDSNMPIHADWTYVDETKFASVSVWIPLADVTSENGCLGIIPFSQNITATIRGPEIRQLEFPCDEILIKKRGKLLPLTVGNMVIYNHKLLHYSPSNNSGKRRLAINLSFAPEEAELFHYCIPQNYSDIHKFDTINSDFYINYDNFQMPERGRLSEKIDKAKVPPINKSQTENFLKKYPKENLWHKLSSFFQK